MAGVDSLKANSEIETGIAAGLKITVNAVLDRKIYLTLQSEKAFNDVTVAWPDVNGRAIIDLDKLNWQEHMGKMYLQIDIEQGQTIFLPIEKWNEIGKWIAEEKNRRENNARSV